MKKAILVVSFGVTSPEVRKKCLEACENKIKYSFPDYDLFRAYTSNRIIKKIKDKEFIKIDSLKEALKGIYLLGYEEVIVQPLFFTYGIELKKIQEYTSEYKSRFKKLILGKPLVSNNEDMYRIVSVIREQLPVLNTNEAVVLMGHGTLTEANYVYNALEDKFRTNDIYAFVGTLNGEYTIDIILERLKEKPIKKVILMPLLLTIGHHVMEDMVGIKEDSWRNKLLSCGYEVQTMLQSLGEISKIGDYFVNLVNKSLE